MMSDKFTDRAGQEINPKDIIIYGYNLGRSAGIRYAIVLELVTHSKNKIYPDKINKIGDRDCKLRIIAVADEWSYKPPKMAERPAIINFGDRILKVQPDQIPEEISAVLNEYKLTIEATE